MNDAMLVTLRNESQFHHLVVAVGDYPLSSHAVEDTVIQYTESQHDRTSVLRLPVLIVYMVRVSSRVSVLTRAL